MESIEIEIQSISMDSYYIPVEESIKIIRFLQTCLDTLREKFLEYKELSKEDEIDFFKEMKPEILSKLIYYNKIYSIELKCPNGSDIKQKDYYNKELDSLTFFFNRNLDFYQYYRSKSTHFDEYFFLRGTQKINLCIDSSFFISDKLFSTGYDFKIAKILSNEMLRIYLNKKLQTINKEAEMVTSKKTKSGNSIRFTASKSAAIELGYALHAAGVVNNGNVDIKEIMNIIEDMFDLDLGDYYRTYIALKGRKKDRTVFLNHLIKLLNQKMDEDDLRL